MDAVCEVQLVSNLLENTSKEHEQGRFSTSCWHCNCNPQNSWLNPHCACTLMAQCAMKKLTKSRSPLMIASGGISRAVPTCAQPCITNRMLVTDLNLLLLVDSIVLNYEDTNCPGYDLLRYHCNNYMY